MKYWLLLLLIIPGVSAGLEVREYTTHTDNIFVDGPLTAPVLHSSDVIYTPMDSQSHRLMITYSVEILTQYNSAGTRTYGLFLDGIQLPDCQFLIETFNAGTLNPVVVQNVVLNPCLTDVESVLPVLHTHTITVEEIARTGTFGTVLSWNSHLSVSAQEIYEMDPATTFEETIHVTGMEFAVLFFAVLSCLVVWHRTGDRFMPFICAFLVGFIGLIWLFIYLAEGGQPVLWLSTVTFLIGIYMLVRSAVDEAVGRGE